MSAEVISILAMLELLTKGGDQGPPPGPPAPYVGPGEVPVMPGDVPSIMPMAPPALPPPPAPGTVPIGPLAPPASLPPMPPWPAAPVPASLPAFPGPGWVPDMPVTATLAARAAYWNPLLWDYPTKTIRKAYVQEQFGGQWVTFAAAWHPGPSGAHTYMATEAWRLASAAPVAPPTVQPGPGPAVMPPPGVIDKPGPVSPYPGTGAYKSNPAYIKRYQSALSWLSGTANKPAWSPGRIDSKFGANTQNACKAFQRDNGVTPVDGLCGASTAAALDVALGYGHVVPAQTPGAPPVPLATPAGPPSLVSPYPGSGAYSTNHAYIQRYQNALTWLAHTYGHPEWDPQGVDGLYGAHTISAVKAFQQAHGLAADGACGATTAAAIDHVLSGQAAA